MTDIWVLQPNWRSAVREAYSLKTEIIVSRSGREQRRALRQTPRRTVDFQVMVSGDQLRTLKRQVRARMGVLGYMADLPRNMATADSFPIGADTIALVAPVTWAAAGSQVALVSEDRCELRTVLNVTANYVTFTEANATAWPAGALICPVLSGRLAAELSFQRHLPTLFEGAISFQVDPGSEPPVTPPAPAVTWNGREVYLHRANWANSQDLNFSHPTETIDYGVGRIATLQPIPFSTEIRNADYLAINRAEALDLLNFYLRAKGRQGEFYVPTDEPDIVPMATWPASAPSLTVAGTDFATAYSADRVYKAISVRMIDGRRFYRTVTSVTISGGNSVLTMDSAPPYNVTLAELDVISWMPVCRLASDEFSLEWVSDSIAQTRLSYQTLEALSPE